VRRRVAVALPTALCAVTVAAAAARAQLPPPEPPPAGAVALPAPVPAAAPSLALGKPWHGRLVDGVELPDAGAGFLSYDAVRDRLPDRPGRRWGTQRLVDVVEAVCASYAAAHPDAPPILVADLSRPHGGPFGKAYGGLGHASHQNGLDADVYYPRLDRLPTKARRAADVDRALAQDLVDRFVAAGVDKAFVGLHVGLRGPRRVVQAIPFHDDHVHVRIFNPARS
jgi:murein endopeptidase